MNMSKLSHEEEGKGRFGVAGEKKTAVACNHWIQDAGTFSSHVSLKKADTFYKLSGKFGAKKTLFLKDNFSYKSTKTISF